MYAKMLIKSELEVVTGLHIGGSSAYFAIGALDSPVIIDMTTKRPIIPGSSLKGKLRTLLVRSIEKDITKLPEPDDDKDFVKRLFGSSSNAKNNKPAFKSRLQFADAFVTNADEFKEIGLTEIKFENTINRKDGSAKPRQIERINPGVRFEVNITYDLVKEEELMEDMKNLSTAMKLLQLDYLGGHGTRGSGRVSFKNFDITAYEDRDCIISKYLNEIYKYFRDVEDYELLSTKAKI
mgnify:CR=1 FL=1